MSFHRIRTKFNFFCKFELVKPTAQLFIFCTYCLSMSCQTVPADVTPNIVESAPAAVDKKPSECPVADAVCTEEFNPSVCTAPAHESKAKDHEALRTWGQNPCIGKAKMAKLACARGLEPSALGPIECVPDPSGGRCPPTPSVCIQVFIPSLCTVDSYNGQALTSDQKLRARGSNACVSTNKLHQLACELNLNPEYLENITCVTDKTGGECPVKSHGCGAGGEETVCQVKKYAGAELTQPLASKGKNPCVAKWELTRLACKMNMKPSQLEDVVCGEEN